jgi:hypothetical protein
MASKMMLLSQNMTAPSLSTIRRNLIKLTKLLPVKNKKESTTSKIILCCKLSRSSIRGTEYDTSVEQPLHPIQPRLSKWEDQTAHGKTLSVMSFPESRQSMALASLPS